MKQNITRSTAVYAAALVLLGLVGYFVTGMQSITALIPAFFAIVVVAVKLPMLKRSRPSTTLWTLVAFAIVGIIATAGGVPKAFAFLLGQETARPAAVVSQSLMAFMSLAYALTLLTIVRKKSATESNAMAR